MRNAEGSSKPRRPRRCAKAYKYIADDFGNEVLVIWCGGGCGRWLTEKHFSTPDKETGRPRNTCKQCRKAYLLEHRKRKKAHYQEYNKKWRAQAKENPYVYRKILEKERASYRRRKEADPEKINARARETYHRIKQDPERHKRLLETRRIAYKLRQERKGVKVQPGKGDHNLKWKPKYPKVSVSTVPIADWVDHQLGNGYCGSVLELAKSCGVSERLINKIKDREETDMPLTTIDKMLTNEGSTPLQELYP